MKNIFNGWRKFSQPILLAEGRISDTKKKYPELDEQGLIDILIDRDPSGNQKYLTWAAKQLAARPVTNQSTARSIAELIVSYHKLMPILTRMDPKNKDINYFKKLEMLTQALEKAQAIKKEQDAEKAKLQKEKEEAMEGTDIVYKDEEIFMVRPKTKEASCYWGKGSKWCISATKYRNYFDEYSKDGKGFLFLFFKKKKNFSTDETDEINWRQHKMVALEFDTFGGIEFVQGWDAQDNPMHEDEIYDIIGVNVMGTATYNAFMDFKDNYDGDFEEYAADADPEEVKLISDMYKKDGYDFEEDYVEDVHGSIVYEKWSLIESYADQNLTDSPVGPGPEDYDSVMEQYSFSYIYVNYEEHDENRWYWAGYSSINGEDLIDQIENELNFDTDDIEDLDIEDLFDESEISDILSDNSVYPDEIHLSSWSGNVSVDINFNPEYDEGSGIDGFDNFLSRMKDYDNNFAEAMQDLKKLIVSKLKAKIEAQQQPEQLNLFESRKRKIKIKLMRQNKC